MRKAKDNPYASSRLERLLTFDPSLINDSWEAIEARWQQLGWDGIVLGCHGSGKTTFLLGFKEYLENAGEPVAMFFFNDQKTELDAAETKALQDGIADKWVFVDGIEYLVGVKGWLLRRKLKQGNGWLVAKHRVTDKAQSKVLVELEPTEALACSLLKQITHAHQVGREIQSELNQHNKNLREMWFARYDQWARGEID